VLAVLSVVGLAGAIGLAGLAVRSSSTSETPTHDSAASPQPSAHRADGAATGSVTTSNAEPTTTPAPTTATSSTPSGPQKVFKLGDNPIFADFGLAPVDCRLPRLAADPPAQAAFFQAAVDCLNRAWLPALAAVRLPADPPQLVVPTAPYSTPCGNKAPTDNANYCEGVIYMPPRYFTEVERIPPNRPAVYLGVLAHEYGHHVQELAGVMDAAWERRYGAGVNSPVGLDVSRRNELGATCFGGMFFASVVGRGSVSRGMLNQAQQDASRRGDNARSGLPKDHGTPRNNGAWFQQGARSNRAFQCNTWQAPPESVS
jgi:uncharacterized protein